MARGKSNSMKDISAYSDDAWRTEGDLRTLIEAEKIQKDPKRLKAAQKLAKEQVANMRGIAEAGIPK